MAVAFIAGAVTGGLIVALIIFAYLNGKLDEMVKAVDDMEQEVDVLIESYKSLNYINDKIIEMQQGAINSTYTMLVNLRNNGTENLDEAIGILGEVLDDHAEEEADDESNSN